MTLESILRALRQAGNDHANVKSLPDAGRFGERRDQQGHVQTAPLPFNYDLDLVGRHTERFGKPPLCVRNRKRGFGVRSGRRTWHVFRFFFGIKRHLKKRLFAKCDAAPDGRRCGRVFGDEHRNPNTAPNRDIVPRVRLTDKHGRSVRALRCLRP